jgi:hypothetical protein
VRHRFTIDGDRWHKVTQMAEGNAAVGRDVVSVGPLLRGGPWVAANGPGPVWAPPIAHPNDGTPVIAQRFAIDYVMVDTAGAPSPATASRTSYYAEGSTHPPSPTASWWSPRTPFENIPGANSRAVLITLETIGGNHVILDPARTPHLCAPSRVAARRCDRGVVRCSAWSEIRHSTEPHLHFHISDPPSPLGLRGFHTHDQFEPVGRCRRRLRAAITPEAKRGNCRTVRWSCASYMSPAGAAGA